MRPAPLATRQGSSHGWDQRHPGLDYPSWVPWLTLAIVVSFAIFGSLPHHGGGLPHPVALALIWLSIVPWVLDAVGLVLPRWAFGMFVLAPQAVLHIGGEALGIADLTDEGPTHMAIMIVVFAAGEVAATARWRVALPVAVSAAAIVAGRGLVEPRFDAGVFWAGGAVMALGIGYMMRRQAETTFQLRAAQDALAREAVLQERHRIAREVHDVIAHSLTVTMMHVTAARMAIRRDPAEAESTLQEAERLGRQSLADIRRTVGLLRDADAIVEPPQPDVRDVEQLLSDYRGAGMDVHADLDEELGDLPASTGLAVYRIIQESLTNAGQHAPGAPARVSIHREDDAIELNVRNRLRRPPSDRDRATGGMGIVGMRERAALLGGSLRAGVEDGEWLVHGRIPVGGAVRDGTVAAGREEVTP